jgi:hypothetical protein
MLGEHSFPGRIHFIAHAVRDIADRLITVLDPQVDAKRVQYENELDRIEKHWPTIDAIGDDKVEPDNQDTVRLEFKVAVMIDSLVRAHRARRRNPSNYELLFRFLMRQEPSRSEVNERLVRDFKKVRHWFMERTHLRTKKTPLVDESELNAQFSKFEAMLHSFVGDFFTGTAELDEILQQANR